MKTENELRNTLRGIDHKSYPAYKQLSGVYGFGSYVLSIDHVQGDPFASPSSLHVEVSLSEAGFPSELYADKAAKTAFCDYLTRCICKGFEKYNFKAKGSGKSGLISITRPNQTVMERSACEIINGKLIVRFSVGFPAFGRTINSGELEKILFAFLPRCVEESLFYRTADVKALTAAVHLAEDQAALRELMKENGLVSFVADGAILPRKSGVSDLPMKNSVEFSSPEELRVSFSLPHYGHISGMGVKKGITLIVGGGYHGKSTLLEAMQMGVYNHIEGDGREFVLTDATAVKLRAEDGRCVRNVDISMFINDLPNKKDTTSFTTEDASGSTSQAAGIIEGIESGTGLFLIDEDTSATNFMVRDKLMQKLISREKEPITPFLERARDLYERADISTILVAGSSGAFFYIADTVILMDCYKPCDITAAVKAECNEHDAPRIKAPDFKIPDFKRVLPRYKAPAERGRQHEHMKLKVFGTESFSLGRENVNVRYLEQLEDAEQTAALANLMRYGVERITDGKRTVRECAEMIYEVLEKDGWRAFCSGYVPCGLAKPRIQELYACMNRFRGGMGDKG